MSPAVPLAIAGWLAFALLVLAIRAYVRIVTARERELRDDFAQRLVDASEPLEAFGPDYGVADYVLRVDAQDGEVRVLRDRTGTGYHADAVRVEVFGRTKSQRPSRVAP